ncbi:MAG: PAS domain S-box protein [Desulfococcaceae bacterium]
MKSIENRQLESSEEFLRVIIENIPDPVFITDDDGNFTFAAANVSRIMGYSLAEIQKMGNISAFLGKNLFCAEELEKTGEIRNMERIIPDREGREYTFLVTVRRISLQGGTRLYICRDISERKQAEEYLRGYRHIISATPDSVSMLDRNYTYRVVNDSYIRRTGKARDEIIGHTVAEIIGKEVFENLIKGRLERCLKGETFRYQSWFDFKREGRQFMDVTYSPYREDDRISGVVVSARDITDVKTAEEALRESEATYAALVNGAMDGIVLLRDSQIIFANPAMSEILGYSSPEELVNTDITEHIAAGSRALLMERIRKRIRREEISRSAEMQAVRRDGTICNIEIYGAVIEYQGNPALLGFIRDISERKQVEKTLRDRERQLRQAEKMEAIGTLAAGIAHDFNNILGSIILNTEFVMHKMQESPEADILSDVLRAANRARDLVKQILTFSRQTVRKRKAVRISPIFRETLKLLRATVPKTIEIRHTMTLSADDRIVIDPTEFHQIMMNLCSNAVHAIGDRSGEIEIFLAKKFFGKEVSEKHPEMKPGQYLSLWFRDSGKGIPAGHMERIFDPFFTTKRAGEGTGMGLAVVHGIVKDCRGGIFVISSPGKGSIFEICLPMLETLCSDEKIVSENMQSGKGHILLADDEPELAEATRRILETLGYSVQSVTDFESAIRIFRAQSEGFDLLISDLTLFIVCEGRFAEEILKIRKDMPIILCTGYSEPVLPEPLRKLRIEKILSKPFAWRDMAETVSTVLAQL